MANDRKGSKPSNGNGSHEEPGRRNGRPNGSGRLVEPVTYSLDRRDFVKLAGLSIPFASLLEGCTLDPDTASVESAIHIEGDVTFDFSLNAMRKEDFVFLRFDFLNFAPDSHHRNLVRQRSGEPSLIVVNFQPQHVTEQAFIETSIPTDPASNLPADLGAAIGSRIAGGSRLAFVVPPAVSQIPLSLSGLLGLLRNLELHVAANALPRGERVATMEIADTPLSAPLRSRPQRPLGRRSRVAHFLYLQRMAFADRHWQLRSSPVAAPPEVSEEAGAPTEPQNHETALEIPHRLILSPNKFGAWAHATEPVESQSGRIELWHTRLGVRADGGVDESDPAQRTARAIWTRDPDFLNPENFVDDAARANFHNENTVFGIEALGPVDRANIVQLSSNFERFDGTNPDQSELPSPVNVNRMMLTAMGGWLDSIGEWPQSDIILVAWEHRATLGRDHYVKVVQKGVLYPYGHAANLILLTERKFVPGLHPHTALLRKRVFIVVQEPLKAFTTQRAQLGANPDASDPSTWDLGNHLRKLPFQSILVKTLVTPNLDADNVEDAIPPRALVPRVGGTPYRFRFEALDIEGNLVRFSAPVSWIPVANSGIVPVKADFDRGKALYLDTLPATDLHPRPGLTTEEKLCPLDGQRVAFAPSNEPDDAVFENEAMLFGGFDNFTDGVVLPPYPGFIPVIDRVDMELQAVRQVSGTVTAPNESKSWGYHEEFVAHGFPETLELGVLALGTTGNLGEMLLKNTPLPIGTSGTLFQDLREVDYNATRDKAGGLATPNLRAVGVSRLLGPVSGVSPDDIDDVIDGAFNPEEFFKDLQVKLFGAIDLVTILKAAGIDLSKAPKYITDVISAALGFIADLERLLKDLESLPGYNDEEGLLGDDGLIQTLLDNIQAILEGDPSGIEDIDDQVGEIVTALGQVPGHLQELFDTFIESNVPDTPDIPGMMQSELEQFTARANRLIDGLAGGVPQLLEQLQNLGLGAEFPKEIRTRLQWRGTLQSFSAPANLFSFTPRRPDGLSLGIEIIAKTDAAPTTTLSCALENFDLGLFDGTLTLLFKRAVFKMEVGKKPDVIVEFEDDGIQFGGVLAFINTLKDLIPLAGFSDPPNVDVDASGIRAGFSVALPNVAIGVFSLENLSLGAELRIPFVGPPLSFRFDFCTRDNPFSLTVALLGGGGFFGVTISPDGLEMLEAVLEATARLSVNFVVASGSVSASLGIYFKLENVAGDKQVTLTGYFKLHGEVDVLGLISASITLTLSLAYNIDTGKLKGKATLEIEVEVLFFSTSVTIECERTFAGSNGDPTFRQIMAPDGNFRPWNTYLEAFAA
jgi:hypothetical protein